MRGSFLVYSSLIECLMFSYEKCVLKAIRRLLSSVFIINLKHNVLLQKIRIQSDLEASLLNYVPYVLFCTTCLVPYVLSCLTCSRVSCALCCTCCCALHLYISSCKVNNFTCVNLGTCTSFVFWINYFLHCNWYLFCALNFFSLYNLFFFIVSDNCKEKLAL